MQKDDFMQCKLRFMQIDLPDKIAIYIQTPHLSNAQYRKLLRLYPYAHIAVWERALARL